MFLTACSTHQSIENSATASIQDKDAALAEDPFLWLEEVESGEALEWAKEQNSKTVERLQGDSRYQELYDDLLEVYEDPDKITRVTERGDFLYNFWRDAEHVQGIYRRTTLDSYRTGTPEWETIIDLDALSKEEGKTWVYRGISCLAPDYELCMLRLSDGGSDAIYSREFNLHTGEFVKDDAFLVPESKHRTTWIDEDTLMLGYDYGPDSVTESGYPRTVRLWKRGQSLEEATLVFEGEKQDVSAGAWRPDYPEVDYTLFFRSLDFYNQDYYVQFDGDEELRKIPFPTSLDVVGAFQHYLIYTNRKDWKPDPLWGIDRTLKQ
ncbi:MAG: S9 family peptidase, partial [Opitutales bacterium]